MRSPVELRGDALYALYPAFVGFLNTEMAGVGGDDAGRRAVWDRMAGRVFAEVGPSLGLNDERVEPYVLVRQIGGEPQHVMGRQSQSSIETVRMQVSVVVEHDDLSGGFFARGLIWSLLDTGDIKVDCGGYQQKVVAVRKEWVNVQEDQWWTLATDYEVTVNTAS